MEAWHDSDEFWETFAPTLFQERHWESAGPAVECMTALMGLGGGEAVLDLACGPGRISLELARRGFQVTGVDRTAAYLLQAQQRADAQGLDIEWIQADMRDFCRPAAFDAIFNVYTSFGYFEEASENQRVLRNARTSLRAGGALLIDMMGKEVLARVYQERNWQEVNGTLMLSQRQVDRDWRWMKNRWILLRDGERHEFELGHWLYSASELVAMLEEAGFEAVQVYGSFEGTPYDPTAQRLITVARGTGRG